jgi:hypothetical protein
VLSGAVNESISLKFLAPNHFPRCTAIVRQSVGATQRWPKTLPGGISQPLFEAAVRYKTDAGRLDDPPRGAVCGRSEAAPTALGDLGSSVGVIAGVTVSDNGRPLSITVVVLL